MTHEGVRRAILSIRARAASGFDGRRRSPSTAPMTDDPEQTAFLLQRWHGGDRSALDELLSRNLEWVEGFVRRRLGPVLRAREETVDVVQDAVIDILTYGPRFVVDDRQRFRALIGRLVENNLRDKHDYHTAQRRHPEREEDALSRTVLRLGETPSQVVQREERAELTRLALELLNPQEREILTLREYDGLAFAEIAAKLQVTESGARMRYRRAVPVLARKIKSLRSGAIDEAIGE